ncbi:MAG: hypothetical protein D6696_05540 [Acidobacteria bacterium]|nr:MAG: hypothetical protein D6696_05540 [Acidobacteriota bacterium]
MTAIALIPVIATILRIDAGLAYLDQGLLAGLRIGDVGTIYYEMPIGGERQRIEVSRGVVIDVDELGATLEVEPEFQVLPGYSVEFEIPYGRVEPTALLDLARSRLRVRRGDEAAILPLLERLLPDDELVEQHVLRLFEARHRRRGTAPLQLAAPPAGAPSDDGAAAEETELLRLRLAELEDVQRSLEHDLEAARSTIASLRAELDGAAPALGTNGSERPAAGAGRRDPRALVARVMDWAQAWSDQRVDDYLAFYSRDFRPAGGGDREAWEALRRRRISRPAVINVALSAIETHFVDDRRAQVMFLQDYRSTRYRDRVFKQLTLVWEDGDWRILREEVVDIDQPFETSAAAEEEQPARLVALAQAWAEAWSSQRVDDYLAFYAGDFRPPHGLSREAWAEQRRQRLTAPRRIDLSLRQIEAGFTDPEHAWVRFVQSYRADHYRDEVRKRLDLAATPGGWKIVRETVLGTAD